MGKKKSPQGAWEQERTAFAEGQAFAEKQALAQRQALAEGRAQTGLDGAEGRQVPLSDPAGVPGGRNPLEPGGQANAWESRDPWAASQEAEMPIDKKAIEKAFRNQVEGKGFSLIEVLSTCPTNWGMTPDQAMQWVEEKMIPYYPLGVYKDIYAEEAAK